MKIALYFVFLIGLNGGCAAAGADQLKWSVRDSGTKDASVCKIVTDKSTYEKELALLKVSAVKSAASQVDPVYPVVDWPHGARALVFAHGTDGKVEYKFMGFDGLHQDTGKFSFESAVSSRFPDSEVIIVHVPPDYAQKALVCSDGSLASVLNTFLPSGGSASNGGIAWNTMQYKYKIDFSNGGSSGSSGLYK